MTIIAHSYDRILSILTPLNSFQRIFKDVEEWS